MKINFCDLRLSFGTFNAIYIVVRNEVGLLGRSKMIRIELYFTACHKVLED